MHGRGWTRRRAGRGFAYYDSDGQLIRDERLDRVRQLAIPPAWKDVWICPWPNGHIQAVGTDAAGRRQYLYHVQWRVLRDSIKYDRALRLAERLPKMRQAVAEDLTRPGLGRERVLAAALRMLDLAVFRIGNDEYAPRGDDDEGTFGLATLRCEHVRVRRGIVSVDYLGKGGIQHSVVLTDPDLHRVVIALRRGRSPEAELLGYRTPQGWRDLRADDINSRIKELAGDEFTAKDLRTWSATVLAAVSLAAACSSGTPTSRRACQRAVTSAMREVAEHLGNTPTVARKSYVDPRVIECFEQGVTILPALHEAGSTDLADTAVRDHMEHAVLTMLREVA